MGSAVLDCEPDVCVGIVLKAVLKAVSELLAVAGMFLNEEDAEEPMALSITAAPAGAGIISYGETV